jgi:hypothetical protein
MWPSSTRHPPHELVVSDAADNLRQADGGEGRFPSVELKQGDGRMHPTRSINLLSARADPADHGEARFRLLVSEIAIVKQRGSNLRHAGGTVPGR